MRDREKAGRKDRERDTFGVHFPMPELKAFLCPSLSSSGQTEEAILCHKVNTMRADYIVCLWHYRGFTLKTRNNSGSVTLVLGFSHQTAKFCLWYTDIK